MICQDIEVKGLVGCKSDGWNTSKHVDYDGPRLL